MTRLRISAIASASLALVVLAAPYGSAHSDLPLNVLTNGDFDQALAGWSTKGTGSLSGVAVVPGGPASSAVLVREVGSGSAWLHQDVSPVATSPATLLDFEAAVWNASRPMPQGVAVVANHVLQTGQAETTVSVIFAGGLGHLTVYCNSLVTTCAATTFPLPTDGQRHHYQVVLAPALGLGVLLIDGAPIATDTGTPGSVTPPTRVLFGDLAYHVRGLAPDVLYDELYYGAALETHVALGEVPEVL